MYAVDTNNFKPLNTYEAAKEFYENTDVIRGYSKNDVGVPLHYKRRSWKTYSLHQRGNSYAARYYYTDVVTWHPDGWIEIDVSYNSMSTNAFASTFTHRLLGGVHADHIETATHWLSDDLREKISPDVPLWAWLPHNGRFKYKVDGDKVEIQGITTLAQHRVSDLKAAHKVRQKYKTAVEYITSLAAMLDASAAVELRKQYQANSENPLCSPWIGGSALAPQRLAKSIAENPDNIDDQALMAILIPQGWVSLKDAKRLIYQEAYKSHDLYAIVPVPLGKKPNGEYFKI